MELPILFNEKITDLATLPLDAQIKWNYPRPTPFHKSRPCLPYNAWMSTEIHKEIKPSHLIIFHDFNIEHGKVLWDLKTQGTALIEAENYAISFSNYQEFTLTEEIHKHLKNHSETFTFCSYHSLSPFAYYFEAASENKGVSKRILYLPLYCYDFFEDHLLRIFFSAEQAYFIRNSLVEYLYYMALSKPTLPFPEFRPRYRIITGSSFNTAYLSLGEILNNKEGQGEAGTLNNNLLNFKL